VRCFLDCDLICLLVHFISDLGLGLGFDIAYIFGRGEKLGRYQYHKGCGWLAGGVCFLPLSNSVACWHSLDLRDWLGLGWIALDGGFTGHSFFSARFPSFPSSVIR